MYLAKVEEIKVDEDLGYRLTFRYRVGGGIPIIIGSDTVEDLYRWMCLTNTSGIIKDL